MSIEWLTWLYYFISTRSKPVKTFYFAMSYMYYYMMIMLIMYPQPLWELIRIT